MRVRAERPPWYLSVVGGALYVSFSLLYLIKVFVDLICYFPCTVFLLLLPFSLCLFNFCFSYMNDYHHCHAYSYFISQKASATSAAVVSEYVGYLEKGQIPPKVHNLLAFVLIELVNVSLIYLWMTVFLLAAHITCEL